MYVSLRDEQVVHLCNKVEVIRANREKHYRFVYRVQLIFRDTKHNCKDIFFSKVLTKKAHEVLQKKNLSHRFSQSKTQHHMLVQSRANILEIRMNVNLIVSMGEEKENKKVLFLEQALKFCQNKMSQFRQFKK